MKKIIYTVLLLGLVFISCDKETEKHDILDAFFLDGFSEGYNELASYQYFDTIHREIFYQDDFTDPHNSIWVEEKERRYTTEFDNGMFKFLGKSPIIIYNEGGKVDYNQKRDYQIEFEFSINKMSSNGGYVGFAFNITKLTKGIQCFFMKTNKDKIKFKVIDNSNVYKIKEKISEQEYNDVELLTIRRINNRMSFFINKKHIMFMDYKVADNQPSGIGFSIGKDSEVSIKSVRIEYLNH